METKFKTRINAKPSKGEPQKGEPITVPDASPSMRQLLTQFSNGIRPQVSHKGVYNEDYTLPDFERLDLVDIDNILQENKNNIDFLENEKKTITEEIKTRRSANDAAKKAKQKLEQSNSDSRSE